MHELIVGSLSCGAFAWLIDSRLFKGKRKYFDMVNWYNKTVKRIESETNYQRLLDMGIEIADKFKEYGKFIDHEVIRDHNAEIIEKLEDRKHFVLSRYSN